MREVVRLGQIIEGEAMRDAVHVAIEPMVAPCDLEPGQHVDRHGHPKDHMDGGPLVGIVDPFLLRTVRKGERFWLCLYPNTVTSLRHVWTHPEFKHGH